MRVVYCLITCNWMIQYFHILVFRLCVTSIGMTYFVRPAFCELHHS